MVRETEERGEIEKKKKGSGDRKDRENIEQEQQDPHRVIERVLDPAAEPGPLGG